MGTQLSCYHNFTLSMRKFSLPAGTLTSTTSPDFLPKSAWAIGDLMEILPSWIFDS